MTLRRWIIIPVLLGMLVGCNNNYSSGDRVLVTKFSYDNGLTGPERYQVVVFKYPKAPVDNHTPKNYIKRLLGLPGELLAIFFGRIYRWSPPKGAPAPFDDLKDGKVLATDLWKTPYQHADDKTSREWFEEGKFEILRKPPHIMLAMRRIVYDNDFQAKDLKGKLDRWSPSPKSGWKSDGKTGFLHDGAAADIDWLQYQHLRRPDKGPPDANVKPQLITDSMSYNNLKTVRDKAIIVDYKADRYHPHWVGDLMLECNVEVAAAKGEFVLELNKGIYRYQAHWDLATGKCNLKSIAEDGVEKDLGTKDTSVKSPGNYMLRFANVDARLTVWVDRALPFGDGQAYDPPEVRGKDDKPETDLSTRRGPRAGDLKPASIGSKGAAVKINHVRLWRDTYYVTTTDPGRDYDLQPAALSDPTQWGSIHTNARFTTYYVQPGHYMCLGDNSQQSSDSRDWGQVPERLMLGRALVVYFPLDRIGTIR